MRPLAEITACRISFIPVDSSNFTGDIDIVLEIIASSGLEYETGMFSTVVRGQKDSIFKLTRDIFDRMEGACGFVMDVRYSNICGCAAVK